MKPLKTLLDLLPTHLHTTRPRTLFYKSTPIKHLILDSLKLVNLANWFYFKYSWILNSLKLGFTKPTPLKLSLYSYIEILSLL